MAAYIALGSYTEQGVRNIKQIAQLHQAEEQRVARDSGSQRVP